MTKRKGKKNMSDRLKGKRAVVTAAAAGITLSADTRIRFQQFDDFPISADGMAFDDITVTTGGADTVPP